MLLEHVRVSRLLLEHLKVSQQPTQQLGYLSLVRDLLFDDRVKLEDGGMVAVFPRRQGPVPPSLNTDEHGDGDVAGWTPRLHLEGSHKLVL